ncbi:dicarboxylate/amino acid:cation symporter [Reyranella sp. CPCC 100927]|uniref:dicarboxylate/amino acid:cation symporter n=1 Tax=Reyranella sp. CPCC 100927 TaxID=2599616 RepID=UPI0021054C0F|nr:dicarboxylate/amino acid:cation symporter [Reyranella sp. CPCC 100927]
MSDSNPSAASHRDAARRRALSLPVQMLLGLSAGVALGALWPSVGGALQPIGTAFIEAIKMVVIPLIFSAVTLGIYKMGQDIRQLGRVSLVAFGWFFFASFLAILIGVVLDRIFQPGVGAGLTPTGKLPPNLMLSVDWAKYFVDLIPSNVVAAMAGQKVLPTIVFSVLFGLALASMGERSRPIVNTLEALLGAMFTLTKWIVGLAPLAVFAIMAWIFATQGAQTLFALARLIGVLYLGLFILVCIFWAVLLAIGENPLTVTRKVLEPVLLGFTTRSSEVSLPVHMEKLEAMGVPNRTVSIVLPLGYSFNLDGAAMYMALAVTFLAEAYGITLSWSSLATILLTTWIASKGLANVPSGSLVALATVLTAIGLPVEAIAIIAGVDAFMDMGRTAINVYGNTVAVLLVQKFGGVVDDRAPDDGSTGMIAQGQAAQ